MGPSGIGDSESVIVYTHPGCLGGDRAVQFLQRRGIPVQIQDVSENAEACAEFRAQGGFATPMIVIAGKRFVGFNEQEIERMVRDRWARSSR